jgi:hypothetical protein
VFGQDTTTPAFETTFTDVTFAAPPASVFRFVPPTGATVTQGRLPVVDGDSARQAAPLPAADLAKAGAQPGSTRVIGHGWTAVLETSAGGPTGARDGRVGRLGAAELFALLDRASTTVPEGHLVTTALFSLLLTNDGRLFVGAVDGSWLRHVAATTPAR